jgi:hypothetical protein
MALLSCTKFGREELKPLYFLIDQSMDAGCFWKRNNDLR